MGIVKLDDDNLWLDESGGIEMLVSFFVIVNADDAILRQGISIHALL